MELWSRLPWGDLREVMGQSLQKHQWFITRRWLRVALSNFLCVPPTPCWCGLCVHCLHTPPSGHNVHPWSVIDDLGQQPQLIYQRLTAVLMRFSQEGACNFGCKGSSPGAESVCDTDTGPVSSFWLEYRADASKFFYEKQFPEIWV